jgi:arylsulfatase A-like enzyme
MKRIKNILLFIRAHRIAIPLSVFACAAVSGIAYFSLCYYPSDMFLYDNITAKQTTHDARRNSVVNLCAAPSVLSGVKTGDLPAILDDALGTEYRKNDPYTASPYVVHFATGKTGAWLDEKRSFAVPSGASVRCAVDVPSDAVLSFDALFCAEKDFPGSEAALSVTVRCGNESEAVLSMNLAAYNRDAQIASAAPVSWKFPAITADSGWKAGVKPLSRFSGKRAEIIFSCAGSSGRGVCVIGNPVISGNVKTEAKRYNVIHILFDAMSQKYMGVYNSNSTLTPNFDRSGNDFYVFDRMYSLGTKTRVSVSGFLTSKLPPETGHGYNFNILSDDEKNIFYADRDITTLPRVLSAAGYTTLQVGNCGFTNPVLPTAVDYGFDSSYEFQAMPYDSTGITFNFMKAVRENRNHPFYCYVHLNTTHKPRITPLSYYVKGYGGMPSHYWRPNVTGATAYADALFAEMVKFLKKEGLWENTVIVIDSDHGTLFEPSNYGRNYLLEDFSRIPFFLHIPDGLKKKIHASRERITEATSLLNLAPSLLDLSDCGVRAEKLFSGRSFSYLLSDGDPRGFSDEKIFTYDTFGYAELLRGRYKYSVLEYDPTISDDYRSHFFFLGEGIADARESLTDLVRDPLEKKNLIAANPSLADEMRLTRLGKKSFPSLSIFSASASDAETEISVTAEGRIAYVDIPHRAKGDTLSIRGNTAAIKIAPSAADRPLAVRTVPDGATIHYAIKRKRRIVPADHIAAGEYLLPIAANPGDINRNNMRAFASIGLYAPAGISRFKVKPEITVSRMDVRWWQSANTDEDNDGANTNMKDVLKSWGYIQ